MGQHAHATTLSRTDGKTAKGLIGDIMHQWAVRIGPLDSLVLSDLLPNALRQFLECAF